MRSSSGRTDAATGLRRRCQAHQTLTSCGGGGFFCSSSNKRTSRKSSPIRSCLPNTLQITSNSFSLCPFSTKTSRSLRSIIFGLSWSWSLFSCSYLRFSSTVLTLHEASAVVAMSTGGFARASSCRCSGSAKFTFSKPAPFPRQPLERLRAVVWSSDEESSTRNDQQAMKLNMVEERMPGWRVNIPASISTWRRLWWSPDVHASRTLSNS